MSYGLYLSNGTDGAVITNSNNIFNEEIFSSVTGGTIPSNGSVNLTIPDVGNEQLISIDIESSSIDNIEATPTGNTLTLQNNGGQATYNLKVFRFQ